MLVSEHLFLHNVGANPTSHGIGERAGQVLGHCLLLSNPNFDSSLPGKRYTDPYWLRTLCADCIAIIIRGNEAPLTTEMRRRCSVGVHR